MGDNAVVQFNACFNVPAYVEIEATVRRNKPLLFAVILVLLYVKHSFYSGPLRIHSQNAYEHAIIRREGDTFVESAALGRDYRNFPEGGV